MNDFDRALLHEIAALCSAPATEEELVAALLAEGYTDLVSHGGIYYGLQRFIFTHAIMVGLGATGYDHRYCHGSLLEAKGAYRDWQEKGFEGEPEGYIKRKPEIR